MDNAIDALKIGFSVMVFVIALTVSIIAMGQAREVSEEVFYMSDKTNFYEYVSDEKLPEGRIVSGETIIPTLYRYYKENFYVVILDKDGNKKCVFNLEEEIKNYNKDYKLAPWLGNADKDTKLRVDLELSGKTGEINGVKYTGVGLEKYIEGKKFKESFLEQRYSGKQLTSSDNESIEIVKGNTKLWIIYQEQ